MLNLNRSFRSHRGADRRRLMMMAGSAVLLPWLSACGGGAGDEALADTADPHSGLEFPTVAGSPTGTAINTKRALSWSSETEAVLHSAQFPSWAYYTDPTEVRWYITHVGMFQQRDDIYSLGYMVGGEAAWWTVGKDAASGSTSSRTLTAAPRLDSDTSTTFWDAGRRVWVTDDLILDDRRRIQGATVPLKWWFFQAPNGSWYILLDPAYDGGGEPVVHRFAAKDNQYHWPKLSLPGTRTIFEWQGTQPRARFSPVPGYADATVGQSIDMDGAWGSQCVDLAHHFMDVALGVPFRSTAMIGDAYAIFQNAPSSATYDSRKYGKVTFKKVIRGGSNTVPLPGDIVFWAKPDPGHVAIVVDADTSNIRTIDQNWVNFDADKGSPAARVTHPNNSDVAGWLRPTW
jgi:CHAP domain